MGNRHQRSPHQIHRIPPHQLADTGYAALYINRDRTLHDP